MPLSGTTSNYYELQESLVCRICLENDSINNLIYPCKCSGNSKYVHKNCLNEWRTLSGNNERFTTCEICHYRFKLRSQTDVNCTYRLINNCSSDICTGLFLTMILTFGLAYITSVIDTNLIIPKQFNINTENNTNVSIFYLLFGSGIIVSIEYIIVIIGLLMIKNKRLYCKIYCENVKYIGYITLISLISFFLGGILIGIMCLEYCSLFVCQIHIKSLDAVYKENQLEIENYEGNEELNAN